VKGLKGKTYEGWLRSLGLFNLDKKSLRDGLMAVYTFLKKDSKGRGTCLLSLVTGNRM